VQEFKYLGSIMTKDNNVMTEIHQRIATAKRAYFALKDVMKSADKHGKTVVVRTVLCYGREAWTMTQGAEMALAAFERKILRKIFGPVRINGSWRLRYNEELYSVYRSAHVLIHIKLRRLEWAGHVHRMQSSRIPEKLIEGRKLEGRRGGGARRRWIDAVYQDAIRRVGGG
jgi:hypothetical protein